MGFTKMFLVVILGWFAILVLSITVAAMSLAILWAVSNEKILGLRLWLFFFGLASIVTFPIVIVFPIVTIGLDTTPKVNAQLLGHLFIYSLPSILPLRIFESRTWRFSAYFIMAIGVTYALIVLFGLSGFCLNWGRAIWILCVVFPVPTAFICLVRLHRKHCALS